MPRERIHDSAPPGIFIGGPMDGLPDNGPHGVIDVGWSSGGRHVSVVSTFDHDAGPAVISMVNNWLEAAHLPEIDPAQVAGAIPPDGIGLYANLGTREDVNRLITVLRRARDGAFGKDA